MPLKVAISKYSRGCVPGAFVIAEYRALKFRTPLVSMKPDVIAVIDDHPSVLISVGRLLSSLEYAIELYASAKEFLDNAVNTEAICIIVDIELGESCGIELVQNLASAGFTIPVIFMTGSLDESVKTRAVEIGCAAFLSKPFSADDLIDALANLSPRSSS
jgi:FixJ family two-component response regulator